MNDRNKTDPEKLCESLEPVVRSLNLSDCLKPSPDSDWAIPDDTLMCPASESPSKEAAMTNAAGFGGNGSHTSLSSHCLTSPFSLPPFIWLFQRSPYRKSLHLSLSYCTQKRLN
ncbi:hypothetical protein CSKR_112836 [Clonorchis sinensis]|uniref:Uncharacterized protein n=1 Tax=Clonorchis sinensis TaxID=79923 RepID=A0A3R7G985_CLOSI|nr:hypothetical protein CSKR_112836 [Clonorchis sinensis]